MVRYYFQARGMKGVGQAAGSEAKCLEFLAGVPRADLEAQIANPTTAPVVATAVVLEGDGGGEEEEEGGEVEVVEVVDTPLELLDTKFGAFAPLLPEGAWVGDYASDPPEWLLTALVDSRDEAWPPSPELVNMHLLYKWPAPAGWTLGEIWSWNCDWDKKTKEGVVCNYKVWYESDGTWGHHLLKHCDYARNAKERKLDSWVLVHMPKKVVFQASTSPRRLRENV